MSEKRGQASTEYLILIGFGLAILAFLAIIQFEHNEERDAIVISSQVDRIGRKLVDASEEVYFLGEPARTTIKIYLPNNIEDILIMNQTIIFKVRSAGGISDIERYSTVNITGNITSSSGVKHISVRAEGNYVCILEDGASGC